MNTRHALPDEKHNWNEKKELPIYSQTVDQTPIEMGRRETETQTHIDLFLPRSGDQPEDTPNQEQQQWLEPTLPPKDENIVDTGSDTESEDDDADMPLLEEEHLRSALLEMIDKM